MGETMGRLLGTNKVEIAKMRGNRRRKASGAELGDHKSPPAKESQRSKGAECSKKEGQPMKRWEGPNFSA